MITKLVLMLTMTAILAVSLVQAQTSDDIYFAVANEQNAKFIDVSVKTDGSKADSVAVTVRYAIEGRPIVRETVYMQRPESGWPEWSKARVSIPTGKMFIVLGLAADEQFASGHRIERSYGGN